MQKKEKPKNITSYIVQFPLTTRKLLRQLRATIRKAAPDAEEIISYGMPAYKQNGMLLYFAAHTHHIGFYPFISAIATFKKELTPYHTSKGTIQFTLTNPLPLALITKIVIFRVKEQELKAKVKKK